MLFELLLIAAALDRGQSADEKPATACDNVRKQIRRVESRMRAGYDAKEGRRLEDRLRELRARRSKVCR